jgi:hypothetical protein
MTGMETLNSDKQVKKAEKEIEDGMCGKACEKWIAIPVFNRESDDLAHFFKG